MRLGVDINDHVNWSEKKNVEDFIAGRGAAIPSFILRALGSEKLGMI